MPACASTVPLKLLIAAVHWSTDKIIILARYRLALRVSTNRYFIERNYNNNYNKQMVYHIILFFLERIH